MERLTDVEQYASGIGAAHDIERLIDFVERKLVGDDDVKGDPASHSQPDQARNVHVRYGIATMRTREYFVEMNRKRVDRHLLIRYAHKNAGAVRMGEIIGKLYDRLGTRGLNDLVGTFGADDLADVGVHVADPGAIETVRG